MKKLLSLLLTLILCLSLSACIISLDNDDDDKPQKAPVTEVDNTPKPDDKKLKNIEKYLEKNKEQILSGLESGFTSSSSYTCKTDIKIIDYGFVVTFKINEIENADDTLKATMQKTYDTMDSYFENFFTTFRKEIPELEYLKFVICDKNGDVLATVNADGNVSPDASTNIPDNLTFLSVEDFVETFGDVFLYSFETAFTSEGMTCKTDIKAEGNGIVITVKIDHFENVDAATKAQLQKYYNEDVSFEASLNALKPTVPNLEYLKFVICDKNGDVLAIATAGNAPDPVTPAKPAEGYKIFEFDGITIDLPENFEETESNGIKMFYTDKYPEVTDNINFISTSGKATLADCSKELLESSYKNAFEGTGAQFEITNYTTFSIGGKDAIKCENTVTLNGVSMIQTQYIILLDHNFVTVTFTDVSKLYTAEFTKIASTIRVK